MTHRGNTEESSEDEDGNDPDAEYVELGDILKVADGGGGKKQPPDEGELTFGGGGMFNGGNGGGLGGGWNVGGGAARTGGIGAGFGPYGMGMNGAPLQQGLGPCGGGVGGIMMGGGGTWLGGGGPQPDPLTLTGVLGALKDKIGKYYSDETDQECAMQDSAKEKEDFRNAVLQHNDPLCFAYVGKNSTHMRVAHSLAKYTGDGSGDITSDLMGKIIGFTINNSPLVVPPNAMWEYIEAKLPNGVEASGENATDRKKVGNLTCSKTKPRANLRHLQTFLKSRLRFHRKPPTNNRPPPPPPPHIYNAAAVVKKKYNNIAVADCPPL